MINWTWHNPEGFEGDARCYILQIDRLCVRLKLSSILGAIGNRRAITVQLVSVEGIRFNAQRNEEALLNLWAAPPGIDCCIVLLLYPASPKTCLFLG